MPAHAAEFDAPASVVAELPEDAALRGLVEVPCDHFARTSLNPTKRSTFFGKLHVAVAVESSRFDMP